MKIAEAVNAAGDEYLAALHRHNTLLASHAHPSQVGSSFAALRRAYQHAVTLFLMEQDAQRRRN